MENIGNDLSKSPMPIILKIANLFKKKHHDTRLDQEPNRHFIDPFYTLDAA